MGPLDVPARTCPLPKLMIDHPSVCRCVKPRASACYFGPARFCACRHLEEGGGHTCAHALGTAAPLPHTGFTSCDRWIHSRSSAGFPAVCAAAARIYPPFSGATLPSAVAACRSTPLVLPVFSGPFSLQSLPTRLLSSVGMRCCLSISVPVPVPVPVFVSVCLSLSVLCLVSCVLCLAFCVLCLVSIVLRLLSCVYCLVSCILYLGPGLGLCPGSGSGSVSESFL